MGLFAFRENYVRTFEETLVEPNHETRKPSFGKEPQLETPQAVQPMPGNQQPKPRKARTPKAQNKPVETPVEAVETPAKEVSKDADV